MGKGFNIESFSLKSIVAKDRELKFEFSNIIISRNNSNEGFRLVHGDSFVIPVGFDLMGIPFITTSRNYTLKAKPLSLNEDGSYTELDTTVKSMNSSSFFGILTYLDDIVSTFAVDILEKSKKEEIRIDFDKEFIVKDMKFKRVKVNRKDLEHTTLSKKHLKTRLECEILAVLTMLDSALDNKDEQSFKALCKRHKSLVKQYEKAGAKSGE